MLHISSDLVVYKDEDKVRMQELVKATSKERLLALITEISTLQNSMKWSTDKEVIFETGLIKITLNGGATVVVNQVAKTIQPASVVQTATASSSETKKELSVDEKYKEEVLLLLKENHKMIMHTILKNAEIKKVEDDLVHIVFSKTLDDVNKQYMQKDESKVTIKEMIKKAFEKEMKIKYVF